MELIHLRRYDFFYPLRGEGWFLRREATFSGSDFGFPVSRFEELVEAKEYDRGLGMFGARRSFALVERVEYRRSATQVAFSASCVLYHSEHHSQLKLVECLMSSPFDRWTRELVPFQRASNLRSRGQIVAS